MARNIEIKARVTDPAALTARAAALATQGPVEIGQDDTFFRCDAGRLKLRIFADRSGELIFYRRTDQAGPKESFYVRSPTASPDSLREALELAYGVVGRVIKLRTLFLVGRTRVHLDRVQGLGDFLELEVVLDDAEPQEQGVEEAHELMASLGVEPALLIEDAYVDMLARQVTPRGERSD
jgi:predicted adenylyl cyclase CyaB